MNFAVSLTDIEAAKARIAPYVAKTPLIESAALNARLKARVLLKPEILQPTGSFKVRGAFNALLSIPPEARSKGVVAFSSGNHAQAVAYAARTLEMPATIVMPADAPRIKREGTASLGARIVAFDRATEDREAIAANIVAQTGATLVPSFDDPFVIAGQGTLGWEVAHQAQAMGLTPDLMLVPTGGGGLVAGSSLALHAHAPRAKIFAVEPQGFDDHARSLATGTREGNARNAGSIQDSLLSPMPGRLTFPINQAHLAGALSVSDDEALRAVAYGLTVLKLTCEPGGAAALAAVLEGHIPVQGKVAIVVLSGGNADPEVLISALQRGLV